MAPISQVIQNNPEGALFLGALLIGILFMLTILTAETQDSSPGQDMKPQQERFEIGDSPGQSSSREKLGKQTKKSASRVKDASSRGANRMRDVSSRVADRLRD